MTSSTWSLEGELCKLANESDVQGALARLGLIESVGECCQLQELHPWARSGSETYSYVFAVRQPPSPDRVYRFKACVALPGPHGLDEVLARWLRRREVLFKAGASTPALYGAGKGLLLEEEIPLDVAAALQNEHRSLVLKDLINIASALTRLRFSPISPFSDVRSRGRDAVFIDFGSDLGEPGLAPQDSDLIFSQLVDQMGRWGAHLSSDELRDLRDAYEVASSQPFTH